MRPLAQIVTIACAALSANSAAGAVFVYGATLSGSQEEPAITTPGTGSTTITYDDVSHELTVEVSFSDLLGATTASHIHVRANPAAPTGAVATQVPSFSGFPLGVSSGTYVNTFDLSLASNWNPLFLANNGGGSTSSAESALFNALQEGRAYLNVHSNVAPGGEIRGNLSPLSPVPEPATWAMLIAGTGMIGADFRRRARRSLSVRYA